MTPAGVASSSAAGLAHDAWVRAFVALADGVTHLHPDDLPRHVSSCAALVGGRETTLLLVDIDQQALHPFLEAEPSYGVDDPGLSPGTAYRTESIVVDASDDSGTAQLWIPLMDSAERLGVLGVVVTGDQNTALWSAFASVVGETVVAKMAYGDSIVRTRRTRDVSLAAEMRWSLLPPLTFTSPQVEISGLLAPAHEIAGDTFDYAVNGNVLSFAVLDAMGHGLEASRIATLAVAEYRRGRRSDSTIGELLHGIDEVIASQFGQHRFVTGQIGELDLTTGRLTLANAAHPAPLVFRNGVDDGDLPCQPCPPMGLGLITTHETSIDLAENDVVVFHTDGVTEAHSPSGEDFGRDGLAHVVTDALRRQERPAEVLRQVVRAVSEHTDGPMRDDATAIFLRRGSALPVPATVRLSV